MGDLNVMYEYLATELLGWERHAGTYFFRHRWNTPEEVRAYLLTGNGMLEIIEAMRERGFYCDSGTDAEYKGPCFATFTEKRRKERAVFGEPKPNSHSYANTLPEAVIRAAYAALKGQGDDDEQPKEK